MTPVATTLRSAYLAGPMRGIEDFNFPEFHKQAAWLRGLGWKVFSPAERDEADEALNGDWAVGVQRGLDYFMQFDLAAVCQTDAVILMAGWENSQGARLEAMTAVEVGHPVFIIDSSGGARSLKSVDPEYIREVFYVEGQGVVGPQSKLLDTTQAMDPPEDLGFVVFDEAVHVSTEAYEALRAFIEGGEPEHVTDGGECWCGPVSEMVEPTYDPVTIPEQEDISALRKAMPVASGVLDYFPSALLEVAKVSKAGNDKHNPGQPLHHARGKSTDHADSLLRHLIDRGKWDEETGQRHSAQVAWRALALLQQELEDDGAPLARGAQLPEEQLIAMLADQLGIDIEGLA